MHDYSPGDDEQREKIIKMQNMLEILTFVKKLEKLMGEEKAAPFRVSDDTAGLEIRLEKIYIRPGQNESEDDGSNGSLPSRQSGSDSKENPELREIFSGAVLKKHKEQEEAELEEEPIEAYVLEDDEDVAAGRRSRLRKRRKKKRPYYQQDDSDALTSVTAPGERHQHLQRHRHMQQKPAQWHYARRANKKR